MKYRNFKQPNAYQYELKNQTNFPALWLQTIHLPLSVSLVLHKICIYLCETICEIESRCLKANKPAKTEATPAATTENAIPKKKKLSSNNSVIYVGRNYLAFRFRDQG